MFCTQCGSEVEEGCEFCTECGARVHEVVAGPYSDESEPRQDQCEEEHAHSENPTQDGGVAESVADAVHDEAASFDLGQAQDDGLHDHVSDEKPGPALTSDEDVPSEGDGTVADSEKKRGDGARLKPYALVAIGSAAIAVICVCVGVFLAGGFSKGRSYAITLPVSAPRLTDAGSRIPVKAQRTGGGPSDVVNTYVSCTGIGLELASGTWEVAVEGSPIAEDGTLYDFSEAKISVEVKEDKSNDSCTAEPSNDLVITPKEMVSIPDSEIEDAVKWAKNDTGRTSGSSGEVAQQMSAEEVDELASKLESAVKSKRGEHGYDLLLAKLRSVQSAGWTIDNGLEEIPLGGPARATKGGKSADAYKTKLMYALYDISGDGVDELLIYPQEYSELPESTSFGYMMLYSLIDGKPACIDKSPCFFSESDVEWHNITEDGRIEFALGGHEDGSYRFFTLQDGEFLQQVEYSYYAGPGGGEYKDGNRISAEEYASGVGVKYLSPELHTLAEFSPSFSTISSGIDNETEGEISRRCSIVKECFETIFTASGMPGKSDDCEKYLSDELAGSSRLASPGQGFGSADIGSTNRIYTSLMGLMFSNGFDGFFEMVSSYRVEVEPIDSQLFVVDVRGSLVSPATQSSSETDIGFIVGVDSATNLINDAVCTRMELVGSGSTSSGTPSSNTRQEVLGYNLSRREDYALINTFLSNFTEARLRSFDNGRTDSSSKLSEGEIASFVCYHCGINYPEGIEDAEGPGYEYKGIPGSGGGPLGTFNSRVSADYVREMTDRFFGSDLDVNVLTGNNTNGMSYKDGYVYFGTTAPFTPFGVAVATSLKAVGNNEMEIGFDKYLASVPYDATDAALYGLSGSEIASKIQAEGAPTHCVARVKKVADRERSQELVLVAYECP